jgi:FkbM family methyltransferase
LIADLGWRVTLIHLLYKFLRLPPRRIKLRSCHLKFPVYARLRSSDILLFRNIFSRREFSCIDDLHEPRLIIDCGANVGYTTAYFLSRFPHAFVIAVEPDPRNFELLQENLVPYAGRYKLIQAAVWSRNVGLKLSQFPTGRLLEWGTSVREVAPNESEDLHALTLNEILAESGFDEISLLKMDVEGAEKAIFSGELEPWLSKSGVLTVELHSDESVRTFEQAVLPRHFKLSYSNELAVCKRA